jgi:O-antigen/teichoic acid export membrane protein
MSIKDLSTDFAFYGLLDLLQRSIGLIMVPIYTRVLTPQQFGDLDILLIMVSVLTVIVDLQFVSGFSRLYLEHLGRGQGHRFAGTVLVVRLLGGLTIGAAVVAAGMLGYIDWGILPSFAAHQTAWLLVVMLVSLTLVYDVFLLQVRMLRWKQPFAAGAFASTVLSGIASVVCVAWYDLGMNGVMLGLVLGKAIGLLVLGWSLRHEVAICVDRMVLRILCAYALPLIPGWWLSFASAYVGRFFVYGTLGPKDNAVLAVTMKLTGVIGMFAVSFRSAWLPLAMSYIGDADGTAFYVRSMRLFMAGSLCSTICMTAFLHPVLAVFAPGPYAIVELYFPLFAVGTLIAECESNLQLGNQIAKRTHWISLGGLVYLVVNVIVLMALTAKIGLVAAGVGLALAAIARTAVTYLSAQHNWNIPYDTRSMVLFGGTCIGFLALAATMMVPNVQANGVRIMMLVLGISLPWLMLERAERQVISTYPFRWLRGCCGIKET